MNEAGECVVQISSSTNMVPRASAMAVIKVMPTLKSVEAIFVVKGTTIRRTANLNYNGEGEIDFTLPEVGCYTAEVTSNGEVLATTKFLVQSHGLLTREFYGLTQPFDVYHFKGKNPEETSVIILRKGGVTVCRDKDTVDETHHDLGFNPFAIASLEGYFFLTDPTKGRVLKYDESFTKCVQIYDKGLNSPKGIATMEGLQEVFVANCSTGKGSKTSVLALGHDGTVKKRIGESMLLDPWSIKINSQRELFVSDSGGKSVHMFNIQTGDLLRSFPIPEINGIQMKCRGLDVDMGDNVYVALRGDGFRMQYECINVYTKEFEMICSVVASEPPYPNFKRMIMSIPYIGIHLDSIIEDIMWFVKTAPEKELHFVRGISHSVYNGDSTLLVSDAGNRMIKTYVL